MQALVTKEKCVQFHDHEKDKRKQNVPQTRKKKSGKEEKKPMKSWREAHRIRVSRWEATFQTFLFS
jgi:hypothetical protein